MRIDARSMLPADMASEGFDNVAEVLRVTPTHIEQYVAAARDISILAVGEKAPAPDARRLSRGARRCARRTSTACRSARATACVVEHNFPADGTLRDQPEHLVDSGLRAARLSVRLARVRAHGRRHDRRRQGIRRQHRRRDRLESARSGPDQRGRGDQEPLPRHSRRRQSRPPQRRRRVRRAQLRRGRLSACSRSCPAKACPTSRGCYGMEIIGPFDPTGIAEPTESRARIFSCYPQSESEEQAVRHARF